MSVTPAAVRHLRLVDPGDELIARALPLLPHLLTGDGPQGTQLSATQLSALQGSSAGLMVGYLVLAPSGVPPSELFSPTVQVDPALLEPAVPETDRAEAGSAQEPPTPPPLATGGGSPGLYIDAERRTAEVDGRWLDLTYLEFELLAHLVSRPHRVRTREQLVLSVWGYEHVGDGRTVDVHIARLRRKLGPAHRASIVTVRRVGYTYAPRDAG